jgi:putative SOS response-associated peptidase YedK
MCGRAAQTQKAVMSAATTFGASVQIAEKSYRDRGGTISNDDQAADNEVPVHRDNFNMSPGMDVMVIYQEHGKLQMNHKKWGLITKSGTSNKPLYQTDKDILQLCFANLCFNARSDTLYTKPTFSRLALQGKACIVALDGYFEWKATPLVKGKQPYFVYRNPKQSSGNDTESATDGAPKQPLLVAGLWTRVSTGHIDRPTIESFSLLTTEACPQLSWLHSRMPVCVWEDDLAMKWLTNPSETLKNQLDDAARNKADGFAWHKVTPEMSKLQFRGQEAVAAVKETTQSVKNFFTSKGANKMHSSHTVSLKRLVSEIGVNITKETVKDEHDGNDRGKINAEGNTSSDALDPKKRSLDAISKQTVSISSTKQSTSKAGLSTPLKKVKRDSNPSPGDTKQRSITSFFQQKR